MVRRMLADPKVAAVVVEHRDRLGRMNTELVEAALGARGRRLVVLGDGVVDEDLVRDVVEGLASFCARLWPPVGTEPSPEGRGLRPARHRARRGAGRNCRWRRAWCRAWLTAGAFHWPRSRPLPG